MRNTSISNPPYLLRGKELKRHAGKGIPSILLQLLPTCRSVYGFLLLLLWMLWSCMPCSACEEVLSLVLADSLRFCSACHDCKLSPEFLIYLASEILFELAKRRELRLSEKEVSCLRSSGLLVARKNWNLSQRVGLKSLPHHLFLKWKKQCHHSL